jgi:hypothetical protein
VLVEGMAVGGVGNRALLAPAFRGFAHLACVAQVL